MIRTRTMFVIMDVQKLSALAKMLIMTMIVITVVTRFTVNT